MTIRLSTYKRIMMIWDNKPTGHAVKLRDIARSIRASTLFEAAETIEHLVSLNILSRIGTGVKNDPIMLFNKE